MSTINRYMTSMMAPTGICVLGGALLVLATTLALAAPPPSYPLVWYGRTGQALNAGQLDECNRF